MMDLILKMMDFVQPPPMNAHNHSDPTGENTNNPHHNSISRIDL